MASARPPQSRGQCAFCKQSLAKGGMRRHLERCEARAKVGAKHAAGGKPSLHLIVEDAYVPAYWLHLETAPDATLSALDGFLRRIWLECCGHMSDFEFGRGRSGSNLDAFWSAMLDDDGPGRAVSIEELLGQDVAGDEPPEERLSQSLPVGNSCKYTYDFGSSTNLTIRAVAEVIGRSGTDPIVLLARNEAPDFDCVECGGVPCTKICSYGCGPLCKKCARKHECGSEALLPLVNSPRTGVCAYTGRD